jgi:hypothetical protein
VATGAHQTFPGRDLEIIDADRLGWIAVIGHRS